MTDYKKIFRESLDELKNDGNYRIFADLEKIAGNFPQALNYKDNSVSEVTVWCSNDYLGMSQNDIVIESMIEAVKKVGAGSGGTRNISGTNLRQSRSCSSTQAPRRDAPGNLTLSGVVRTAGNTARRPFLSSLAWTVSESTRKRNCQIGTGLNCSRVKRALTKS